MLGKANLSVLNDYYCMLGEPCPNGWSPRGGQTRNPHGRHLTPWSSSAGSASAVAAGFCAAAIGGETCGSLVSGLSGCFPLLINLRPSLHTHKASTRSSRRSGSFRRKRPCPSGTSKPPAVGDDADAGSSRIDCLGPLAKCVWDVAALLDICATDAECHGFLASLQRPKPLSAFRLGVIGPSQIRPDDVLPSFGFEVDTSDDRKTEARAHWQQIQDTLSADGATLVDFHVPGFDHFLGPRVRPEDAKPAKAVSWGADGQFDGSDQDLCFTYESRTGLDAYLGQRRNTDITSLRELVKWNDAHPVSLPLIVPSVSDIVRNSLTTRALPERADSTSSCSESHASMRTSIRRQYNARSLDTRASPSRWTTLGWTRSSPRRQLAATV